PGGSRTSPSTVARVEGLVSRWHLPGSTNALEAAKAKSLHQLNRAIAQLKPEVGAAGSIGFTRTTSIWGGFAVVAWVGCVVDCAATASDHATAPSNVMNSRRLLIRSPRRGERAAWAALRGRGPWRSAD